MGVQEQRIPPGAHIVGHSLHWSPSTWPCPLLVSPLVGHRLQATVHLRGGGDCHCDRPLQGDHYLLHSKTISLQGLHTTRYVKTVYRQLQEEANMVVPVTGGPGYRTIRDFRFVIVA